MQTEQRRMPARMRQLSGRSEMQVLLGLPSRPGPTELHRRRRMRDRKRRLLPQLRQHARLLYLHLPTRISDGQRRKNVLPDRNGGHQQLQHQQRRSLFIIVGVVAFVFLLILLLCFSFVLALSYSSCSSSTFELFRLRPPWG